MFYFVFANFNQIRRKSAKIAFSFSQQQHKSRYLFFKFFNFFPWLPYRYRLCEFRFRGNNTHSLENIKSYTSCENKSFRETCQKNNNPVVTSACREPGGCTDEPYYDCLTLFWPCAQFNVCRVLCLTVLWHVLCLTVLRHVLSLTLLWRALSLTLLWRELSITLLWLVLAESLVDVLMNPITTV